MAQSRKQNLWCISLLILQLPEMWPPSPLGAQSTEVLHGLMALCRQLRTQRLTQTQVGEVFTLTVSFTQFHTHLPCREDVLGSGRSKDAHDLPHVASNWTKGSGRKDMKPGGKNPCWDTLNGPGVWASRVVDTVPIYFASKRECPRMCFYARLE